MSENMTYVPSRLTSAKTNKVVAGANEILDDDINLKQDVINTLSKKVIDLNSVPTSSTLTYTVNSVTCNFKVGDEVRVADQESETGYTFYKLYELTTEEGVTTATWDKLGAGGGSSSIESNIIVNLIPVVSGSQYSASLLNGVEVELWNVSDNKSAGTKTWTGNILTFPKIMAAKTYKLKFSQKYGYKTPEDSNEFVLGVGETYNVGTIEYTADKYILNISTNQNDNTDINSTIIRVTANGISSDGYLDFKGEQTNIDVFVPKGNNVSVSCYSGQPSVNNYKQNITVVAATNPNEGTPTIGNITVLYETEILTAIIQKDGGSGNMSIPTITVKNGNTTIGTLHNGDSLKIAYGINYVCSASQLGGYSTPASVTKNWANTTTKSLTFLYEQIKQYVDFGFPSGLKWAKGNLVKNGSTYSIGAETNYGTYVSWGNIDGHNEGEGYNFSDANYATTPGHSVSANISSNDASHDICRAKLGSPWRLPTKDDVQELINNTDKEWVINYNNTGVYGIKVMKKSDHSIYIFIPASGLYHSAIDSRGEYAYYTTSSILDSVSAYLIANSKSSSSLYVSNGVRFTGLPIRPVQ